MGRPGHHDLGGLRPALVDRHGGNVPFFVLAASLRQAVRRTLDTRQPTEGRGIPVTAVDMDGRSSISPMPSMPQP
ncbi:MULTISPECIES: hypothetical protein [unclassified Streptomyces]|uniref:hypothetical protein n=1 Tax=unclassified Streptomyces TaxID=2593676 RepID=UPI0013A68876|nr:MULTISPECIES: hypothetical protein [unclassified Streptomyces]QZZ26247.1 hypothetical protein A7X85_08330 [Streptomyces sp. ST1015]